MIWISTLCLLAVAAWLLFNALNERRWVEAHSHDETVASDPGLFSSLTARTSSGVPDADGKLSIDQENTAFARAVTTVKEKTSKYGDKFIEAKAAASRIEDGEVAPGSAAQEDSFFGRAVSKVGATTGRLDRKLDEKIKAASSRTSRFGESGDPDESLLSKVSHKVASSSEELGNRVAQGARNASQGLRDKSASSKGDSVFGKVVNKVSGGVDKLEAKIDSRAAAREAEKEDLVSRVASKVGNKINEMDDKAVKVAKDTVD